MISILVFTPLLMIGYQNCTRSTAVDETTSSPFALLNSSLFKFNSLLWVGAHPDDEMYIAPLLASFCRSAGKSCTLVSLTAGEKGSCHLAGGCSPDVASIRRIEFQASGQYLGANIRLLNFVDGSSATLNGVLNNWSSQMGGSEALVQSLGALLDDVKPDMVITLDPRHGTSCHADHMAAGQLVAAAAQNRNFPFSSVMLVGMILNEKGGYRPSSESDQDLITFSVSNYWSTLLHLIDQVYQSQFNDIAVATVESAPESSRIFSYIPLDKTVVNDSRYTKICP